MKRLVRDNVYRVEDRYDCSPQWSDGVPFDDLPIKTEYSIIREKD